VRVLVLLPSSIMSGKSRTIDLLGMCHDRANSERVNQTVKVRFAVNLPIQPIN